MVAIRLIIDERKWFAECYWKAENVKDVQRRRRNETEPLTRLIIARLRGKFEADETRRARRAQGTFWKSLKH
jgi:hypothetical protein